MCWNYSIYNLVIPKNLIKILISIKSKWDNESGKGITNKGLPEPGSAFAWGAETKKIKYLEPVYISNNTNKNKKSP